MLSTLNQFLHSDITSNNYKLLLTVFAKNSFTVTNICTNIKSEIVWYYYLTYTTFIIKIYYMVVKKQIFTKQIFTKTEFYSQKIETCFFTEVLTSGNGHTISAGGNFKPALKVFDRI